MSATTYNSLAPLLSSYVEPGADLLRSLNQVLARVYTMGTYRDLTVQYSIPVVDAGITLPEDADSVIFTTVNNSPVPVRSMWHDFRSVGSGNATDMSWGLIDSGYWPILRLLPEAGITVLYVVPALDSYDLTAIDTDTGEIVTVVGENADGERFQASVASGLNTITFSETVTDIAQIRFESLLRKYDIRTTAADPDTTIATVGPDSGITRFRRYRLNRSTDGETMVHVLCKRRFQPIKDGNDVVYVTNVGALKHGLLGRIAEDNADLERAQYHWGECQRLLEEEASSSRGAAVPRLIVDPFGVGNTSPLRTLY